MDLLAQMRTFVRIAETGSLSRAARSLRLSLAAVSRQLSALERDLGVPLVLRTTRRLALTEAGRATTPRPPGFSARWIGPGRRSGGAAGSRGGWWSAPA